GCKVMTDRVEQEGSATATHVGAARRQRVRNDDLYHVFGQPVGRVVLPQTMALARVDDALVEDLEHVVVCLLPREASYATSERPNPRLPTVRVDNPVEEVCFHNPVDACVVEGSTREEVFRGVISYRYAKHDVRDEFRHDDE